MIQIQLTSRNCHRANMVINTNQPGAQPLPFNFNSKEYMGNSYMHSIGIAPDTLEIHENNFKGWEVVNFKYEVTLDEYYDRALSAYNHLSYSPRELGRNTILKYEQQLNDDLSKIPVDQHERYIANYKKYFSSWLGALSSCYNTNIAGTTNFNSRQAQKRSNSETNRQKEFNEWRVRALKAIAKQVKANRTLEEKIEDDWQPLKKRIDRSACTIFEINNGIDDISEKSQLVSNLYGKVETFAKNGNVEIVQKAIEYVREWNQKTSVITERHKFFKLLDIANEVRTQKEKVARACMREETFDGGVIVYNTTEDRLQIIYDQKPDKKTCQTIHRHGFNFSRRNMAWQRKLTPNAELAAERLLGVKLL